MGKKETKETTNQDINTIQGQLTKGTRSIARNLVFLTIFFTVFMILIIVVQLSMIRYSQKQSLCILAAEEANDIFREIDNAVYGGPAYAGTFEMGEQFLSLYQRTQSEHGNFINCKKNNNYL